MKNKKLPKYKKYDYSKYTPAALEKRGLSEREQKRLYSKLRKEVQTRIHTLKRAGYGDIDEVKRMYAPTLKEVETKPVPIMYLHAKISEFVQFINNPLTLVRNQKKRREIKMINTLQSHGYNISQSQAKAFGKFWEVLREISNNIIYDSGEAVRFFEDNYGQNKLKVKDIAQAFFEWDKKERENKIANIKLLHPKDYMEYLKKYDLL